MSAVLRYAAIYAVACGVFLSLWIAVHGGLRDVR